LKLERERLGLSQKEVYEAIDASKGTFIRWEAGKAIPSDKLAELVKLGFDVYYVVTGNRDKLKTVDDYEISIESAVSATAYATEEAILSVYQVRKLQKKLGPNGEFDAVKNLSVIIQAAKILAKAELTGTLDQDSIRQVLEAAGS